jgi:hypothetical protein
MMSLKLLQLLQVRIIPLCLQLQLSNLVLMPSCESPRTRRCDRSDRSPTSAGGLQRLLGMVLLVKSASSH